MTLLTKSSSETEDPFKTVVKDFAKKQQVLIDLENDEELKTHQEVKAGVLTVTLSQTLDLDHGIKQVEFDRVLKDGKSVKIGFALGDTLLCAKDKKAPKPQVSRESSAPSLFESKEDDPCSISRGLLVALDATKVTVCFLYRDWACFDKALLGTTFTLTDHFDAFTHNIMTR